MVTASITASSLKSGHLLLLNIWSTVTSELSSSRFIGPEPGPAPGPRPGPAPGPRPGLASCPHLSGTTDSSSDWPCFLWGWACSQPGPSGHLTKLKQTENFTRWMFMCFSCGTFGHVHRWSPGGAQAPPLWPLTWQVLLFHSNILQKKLIILQKFNDKTWAIFVKF